MGGRDFKPVSLAASGCGGRVPRHVRLGKTK